MAETSLRGARVLLVEPDGASADRLALGLGEHGVAVETFRSARSAVARVRTGAADAVLLAAPLADADWIGLAALVKDAPEPPALVVLDGAGVAPALARALPSGRGADAVVERGAKLETVVEALCAALARPAPEPDAAAVPTSLPELLVALRQRGESGVLEVRAEGVCTRIALRAGSPVFAEGGALRETLGRMLLRRGALSESDYVRVIERMTERLMESETTRMGEVLVELGLLTPAEVFEALSAQVREKITACFRWERFQHSFEAVDVLPDELLAYPCPPLETLLLAGLRAHFGPDRLELLLAPFATRRPVLAAEVSELATRFQLTPAEQRFVRGVDGARTVRALRAAAPLDGVHAAQVLAALVLTGAVRWQAAEAREEAGEAPVARPPASRVTTRPVRLRLADPNAETARSLAQMRHKLANASRTARDPRSAGLEAERAFRQGLALLQQSALPGALRAFGRACALIGDEPEYRMYEAWTEVLVARDDAARALARAKAGACAQRVLARDADSARAHAILGQLAAASGDSEGAEQHFRAALRTAPADRDALRGLRLLERRRVPR
jgi:tetratricopeptide (TPR) repeat protein/ActR/RegA family two-component response regulator